MKSETVPGFIERLREAIDFAGGPRNVARGAGVKERSLHGYLAGEASPGLVQLQKIASFTGVDLNWLIAGKGATKAPIAEAIDGELMARVVSAFTRVYKELSVSAVPEELGRLYSDAYAQIIVATDDQIERYAMAKLIAAQHRKKLLTPVADTIGKAQA